MSTKVLSATLLLIAVCLYFDSTARRKPLNSDTRRELFAQGRRTPGRSLMCCVNVTTKNFSSSVTGTTYREQDAGAPCVHAIIFSTSTDPICADPEAKWVQKLIKNMRKVPV